MLSAVPPQEIQPKAVNFAATLPVTATAPRFAGGGTGTGGADTLNKTPRSLLSLSPLQQEVAQSIDRIRNGLPKGQTSEQYVRWLERTKRVPTEVYDAVVKEGLTVVGVPVPKKNALPEATQADPGLMQALSDLKGSELTDKVNLLGSTFLAPRLVDRIGEDDHAALQALSAIGLAKEFSVGVATALGVSSGLAGEAIAKTGTDAQKAIWLNMMQEGLATFAYGLTEAKTGSDPRSINTTWKQDADGNFILNGDKKFIGGMANVTDADGNVIQRGNDFMVTFAVDDPSKPPEQREFRAFVVPREAIGEDNIKRTGGQDGKTGLNEVNNATIQLDNVKVPKAFMLGKGEDIYPYLLKSLDETRLFVGAMSLGTTEATLETIQKYTAERVQNGHPIEEFQAVAFPLRENAADAEAAKLLIMNTAKKVDQILASGEKSEKFRTDTAMSKLFCSELARATTENAQQAMGGNGYLEDENGRGIPKRVRDAKVLTIYEGTTNIQRNLITGGVLITEGKALIKTAKAKAIAATLLHNPGDLLGRIIQRKSPMRVIATSVLEQQRARARGDMKDSLEGSPSDVIEAAYQYAVADNMLRYQGEEKALKDAWRNGGLPSKYDGWDEKSIQRETGMEALNPVQMRMHIMADIAVDRHLAKLVTDELAVLKQSTRLVPAEQERQKLLQQFLKQAKKRSFDRYNTLRDDSLANLEKDHVEKLGKKARADVS